MISNTTIEILDSKQLNYTKNGKCSGCGKCCGRLLPLTQKEVSRIKAYIKRHNIKKVKRAFVSEDMDWICPFRDDLNRKCLIYEIRPEICRQYKCSTKDTKFDFKKTNPYQYKAVDMNSLFE